MPIYDQSYAHWEGRLEGGFLRWLPITLNEIKLAFRSKLFLIVFALSLSPFVVRVGMIYLYNLVPQLQSSAEWRAMVSVDGEFFLNFLVRDQLLSVICMCLFVGCALIAKDLKVRALEIYFSKPLNIVDYLLGKLGVMAFFVCSMTLFPGLLLFLSNVLLSEAGSFEFQVRLLSGIFLVAILTTLTVSLMVLASSALCRSPLKAALLWIGFHLALVISAEILLEIFSHPLMGLIDIRQSIVYLARTIFDVERDTYSLHWIYPLVYLIGLNLLAGAILLRRVKRVEIDDS